MKTALKPFYFYKQHYLRTMKPLLNWLVWFVLCNGVLFCLIGWPYLRAIFSYGTLYSNTNTHLSGVIGKGFIVLFTLINYLSHFYVLAFSCSMIVFLMLFILPLRAPVFIFSIVLFVLAVILLIMDGFVFSTFHFHLNGTVLSLILSENVTTNIDVSPLEITYFLIVVVLILSLECSLAWCVWKFFKTKWGLATRLLLTAFSSVLLSYVILLSSMTFKSNLLSQQISNLPLFHQILSVMMPGVSSNRTIYNFSENFFSSPNWGDKKLHYPLHSMACKKAKTNIILITAEALRHDNLKNNLMPNTSQFGKKSIQFDHHLSGGNATQAGIFSLFYSLPINYWHAARYSQTPPAFNNVLHDASYDYKVIWSSGMTASEFSKTLFLGEKSIRLANQSGNTSADRDRVSTQKAIVYLRQQAKRSQPFFLNIFYKTTHAYCKENSIPKVFYPRGKSCSRLLLNDSASKSLYARYKDTALFVDREIGKVLEAVKKNGLLDNSIVIITSDHGQEFNDTKLGYWGHAGNFTEYQLHVPMIIHWPNKPAGVINYPTSHYDLMPTLLQEIFSCSNPINDYSVGKNMLHKGSVLDFLLVGSYAYMGVVAKQGITVLRKSGEIEMQNKYARPMPEEKANRDHLKKALSLMTRYY